MTTIKRISCQATSWLERQKSHYRDWRNRTLIDVLEKQLSLAKQADETGFWPSTTPIAIKYILTVLWVIVGTILLGVLSLLITMTVLAVVVFCAKHLGLLPPLWVLEWFWRVLNLIIMVYLSAKYLRPEFQHIIKVLWLTTKLSREKMDAATTLQKLGPVFDSLRANQEIPSGALSRSDNEPEAERGVSRLTDVADVTTDEDQLSTSA